MTLVETLIGALIFAFVATGVYMLYTTMQNTMSRGELMSDLQQNARIGLAQMVQEIRMAGYDPSGAIPLVTLAPKAPIRAATANCLSFVASEKDTADRDKDGNKDEDWSVQITYDLSGSTLRRRVDPWNATDAFLGDAFAGGSAQPLAGSMNVLAFTYYDANNQVLTPAAWTSTQRCPPDASASAQSIVQLTFDHMLLIRRVAISLKAQGSRPGVFSEFFTLTSDVRLRNL
jgi:type II secretory pathway component PulJ